MARTTLAKSNVTPILRNIRAVDLQDRGQRSVSPLELGLIELPTRPLNTYTAAVRHEAIQASDQGNLTAAADLTRAAMTEDGYARGVLGSLVYGLWGLPMNFIGDPAMIAALTDSPSGAGEWRTMFPQPEAIRLMSWGITLGVGIGQMRRRYCEPGEDVVSVEEAEDGTYRARRPMRPIGANNTRILRTWDPKNLRHQYWDDTWWLMTADGEIRITPNDGEWILYTPYGEVKPWEYGAWKALTLAFVLGRDGIFDRSRHAEKLAPMRVGKVPQGTTERQRKLYLKQIREMQRMGAFVLPPGLEYSIVEGSGRIVEIYEQVIAWAEKTYCLIFTGNETTTTGSKGFSSGDVQERIAKTTLKSFAGSFASCLHDGGLVDWSVQNYGVADPPLAFFDCDPPEDKLARAKTVAEAGGALTSMSAALKGEGLRMTRESVVAYAQLFGLAVEEIPVAAAAAVAVKLNIAPTDVAKVFTADEIRASEGAAPTTKAWGGLTIPELDAASAAPQASSLPPAPAPPAAQPSALPVAEATIAPSDDETSPTDEDAAALAAQMTEHAIQRCEHMRPNRCPQCGVQRVRKVIPGENGAGHTWGIAWKAIGSTAAQPEKVEPVAFAAAQVHAAKLSNLDAAIVALNAALARLSELGDEPETEVAAYSYNPDQERADDGKFGSGSGKGKPKGKNKAPSKGSKDGLGTSKAAKDAKPASASALKASEEAKASGAHGDAAKAHDEAQAKHLAAAKASRKSEYKAAHQAAADAHAKVAAEHRAEEAKTKVAPEHTPEQLKASVDAKIASLPPAGEWQSPGKDILGAVKADLAHTEAKLASMPQHEKDSCQAYSNGHDYEMRALERGVSKEDLIKSRLESSKNTGTQESHEAAAAHVEKSSALLPGFHAAQDRLAVSSPPPPSLMRGMTASDRTVHELLTSKSFSVSGMSSSATLDPRIAAAFAGEGPARDYRGDPCRHAVIFKIDSAKSMPILHEELTHYPGEKEHVLRRDSTYDITRREVDDDGFIVIHMKERAK